MAQKPINYLQMAKATGDVECGHSTLRVQAVEAERFEWGRRDEFVEGSGVAPTCDVHELRMRRIASLAHVFRQRERYMGELARWPLAPGAPTVRASRARWRWTVPE